MLSEEVKEMRLQHMSLVPTEGFVTTMLPIEEIRKLTYESSMTRCKG